MTAPYYQDDQVTLYHGDCLEIREWLAADVLITDPPYGMKNISRGTYDSTTGITHKPVGAERIASDHNVECRDKALALWGHRPRVVFGTSIMIHTPHGTIEIPHAGKVCRDLATAKAHAADLDSAPDYEAQVSGT